MLRERSTFPRPILRLAIFIPVVLLAVAPSTLGSEGVDEGAGAEAAETAPEVFTNADLPTALSVSVIGPPASDEEGSTWPDMAEIERIARINERARREYESRRPAPPPEPEIVVVRDHGYPWIFSNVRCPYGRACRPYGWNGPHPKSPGPHQRQALPDPVEGYVLRPGPHLGPAGPVPDTIRGRPVRMRPPGRNAPEPPAMRIPERGARGPGAGRRR